MTVERLPPRRIRARLSLLLGLLAPAVTSAASTVELLVVDVEAGGEAQAAGLLKGDVLEGWLQASGDGDPAGQPVPFDGTFRLAALELQAAAQTTTAFTGRRDGAKAAWKLAAGDWALEVRPLFADPRDDVLAASCHTEQPAGSAVPKRFRELRDRAGRHQEAGARAWLAACTLITGDPESRAYARDFDFVTSELGPKQQLEVGYLLLKAHANAASSGAVGQAIDRLAVAAASEVAAGDRQVALYGLSMFDTARGRLIAARDRLATLAEDLHATGRNTTLVAKVALLRAQVARSIGDLDSARDHGAMARQRLDALPGLTTWLDARVNRELGTIAAIGGDLDEAEAYYAEALRLMRRVGTDLDLAPILNNLGIVQARRGDMRRAEFYYRRALSINERHERWISYNRNLGNLADIAYARGDHETSEALWEQIRASFERLSPDSPDFALVTMTLAHTQIELKKYDQAHSNYGRALELYRQNAPDSPDMAGVLLGLGDVAYHRGQLGEASTYFRRAADRRESVAPNDVSTAESYQYVAKAALAMDDTALAEERLQDALAIQTEFAPGSVAIAGTFYLLAQAALAEGDLGGALARYEQAVSALEFQMQQLGGGEDSRALFGDRYSGYFKEYLDLLYADRQFDKSFEILERYRARSLLGMIVEREAGLGMSLPYALVQERREREREYSDARAALVEISGSSQDAGLIEAARARVREAQFKREGIAQRLGSEAGSFASLRYPTAVTADAVAGLLDEGTLAISYSVGSQRTLVFALTRDRLSTYELALGEEELRSTVKRLVYLMDAGRIDGRPDPGLIGLLAELHSLLIEPVAEVREARRLLLVPDGPLHYVPFSALVTAGGEGGDAGPSYLVEHYPLHQVLSLTLYAELRARAPSAAAPGLVAAFGDPTIGTTAASVDEYAPPLLEAVERLPALPWSKTEVENIASVFGDAAAVFIGDRAVEGEFRRVARDADILHVASHVVADESSPLDTAIVLAAANGRSADADGLVHTWEVFEDYRLNNSLVVLSACQSAWGRAASGEGLLGMQRAFHYAGARAVVASLWKVSDRSTSLLMSAFYRALAGGMPVDDALRRGQLALIAAGRDGQPGAGDNAAGFGVDTGGFSHPYYWSGFHLSGNPAFRGSPPTLADER